MNIITIHDTIEINGIKTKYAVSEYGTVISRSKSGKIKELKVFETKKGYLYVKLWINKNQKLNLFID